MGETCPVLGELLAGGGGNERSVSSWAVYGKKRVNNYRMT